MKLGTKIKINKNIGTLVIIKGSYGLIKFEFGKFVFNLNKITEKEIIL